MSHIKVTNNTDVKQRIVVGRHLFIFPPNGEVEVVPNLKNLKPFQKLKKMLDKHYDGILSYEEL